MYHIPTKKFVPLAKLRDGFPEGESFRVDLHPRFSPDGKFVSFDSAHEGVGRQIYMMDISHIIDNPPEP
jgi:Tol biopolymer transport system component